MFSLRSNVSCEEGKHLLGVGYQVRGFLKVVSPHLATHFFFVRIMWLYELYDATLSAKQIKLRGRIFHPSPPTVLHLPCMHLTEIPSHLQK